MKRVRDRLSNVVWLSVLMLACSLPLRAQDRSAPFLHTLEPYKPIYILNSWFLDNEGSDQGYRDDELVLQFSFKRLLWGNLYFAYSHTAFWQLADLQNSRAFRETNYNPEIFLDFPDLWMLDHVRLGLAEHESNGEKQQFDDEANPINFSRTWNRAYLFMQKEMARYLGLGMKVWIVSDRKENDWISFYDDNADIQQYMGSGEIYIDIGRGPTTLSLMLRHGWKEGTETIRVEGRIPLYGLYSETDNGLDLFLQYFSGFGNCLIDYDRRVNRFAVGLSFR